MRVSSFLLLVLLFSSAFGQKNDHVWLFGNDDQVGYSILDFNQFPLAVYHVPPPTVRFDLTNASVSDDEGQLLFYTNGIKVMDNMHVLMENGDSLNPGPVADNNYIWGYILEQGALILPRPGSDSLYLLFHLRRIDYNEPPYGHADPLYFTEVDMSQNGGLGKVIRKNEVLLSDTLDGGKLTATRHANGRDWWLLVPKADRYSYHRFLVEPDTTIYMGLQDVAPVEGYGQTASGNVSFSPDGSRYARHDIRGFPAGHFVRLYDFDRCTGLLSNQLHLPLADTAGIGGVSFSPSSRYLYVPSNELVYQFDTWAADVEGTKTVVAVADGYQDTLANGGLWFPTSFRNSQLGPDGRIYIGVAGSHKHLHVIHRPDEGGLACEVRQHSLRLPTWNFRSMPNFPNYRLGPLDGSPCDTLGLDNLPLAGFTWGPDTLDGLTVQFVDNSFYGPVDWQWDFGGTGTSLEKDPVHTFPSDGVYTVCLTVSSANASDTFCREVAVSDLRAGFDFLVEGQAVSFFDMSTSSPTEWRWRFGDGDTSLVQNPVHVYDAPGVYEVCLRAWDEHGTDRVCRGVEVIISEVAEEERLGGLMVFPNPSTGKIWFRQTETTEIESVIVYNLVGQMLFTVEQPGSVNGIDLSFLPDGVYFVQIKNAGNTIVKKVIKKD